MLASTLGSGSRSLEGVRIGTLQRPAGARRVERTALPQPPPPPGQPRARREGVGMMLISIHSEVKYA